MTGLVDLDCKWAHDPFAVGAKAARLALARSAGLAALPGTVVPTWLGRDARSAAAHALSQDGSGAARRAIMALASSAQLEAELRAAVNAFGETVVVRSSSTLESSGDFAGAFASFEAIGCDEVLTAVRGCWASAFTVDALRRHEATGSSPTETEIAVLIQPQVAPCVSGTARQLPEGGVEVVASRGPSRGLTEGREHGSRAHVAGNAVTHHDDPATDDATITAVAELANQVEHQLGDTAIEWAWASGGVVLLQSRHATSPAPPRVGEPASPRSGHASLQTADFRALATTQARKLAALVERCPGELAEELVLPWLLAVEEPCTLLADATGARSGLANTAGTDPALPFHAIRARAAQLTAHAWGLPEESATKAAADALDKLRRARGIAEGLQRTHELTPPSAELAAAVLDALTRLGTTLTDRGLTARPEEIWHRSASEIERALGDGQPLSSRIRDPMRRWEPFLFATARGTGHHFVGTPAAPGTAAGRVAPVNGPQDLHKLRGGEVVAAARPTPVLAPVLWSAAGLITEAGSPAAHLFDVARSLGLPAIVCSELAGRDDAIDDEPLIAALDGHRGEISLGSAWNEDSAPGVGAVSA
jgi:phosphoenolpyruvate synthase/pyruvate phosphate dikinase